MQISLSFKGIKQVKKESMDFIQTLINDEKVQTR
jgi:hypothetical protein